MTGGLPGLWDHQRSGLNELWKNLKSGQRRICVTSPTGSGKTRMMVEFIRYVTGLNKKVALYTNRVLLTEQTSRVLSESAVEHGIRAAGFSPQLLKDVQICSLMTEHSRTIKKADWELHQADYVLVDEAHVQKALVAQMVFAEHLKSRAQLIGWTATPLGVGHIYNKLIVAGKTPDLINSGILMHADTYGPSEFDMQYVSRVKTGEYSLAGVRKVLHRQGLFGRVLMWYRILNPDQRPAILFAPGVAESKWFVTQLEQEGIRAAHIDGKHIFFEGEDHDSTLERRAEILSRSRSGEIKVVCNRFVLREGIDAPWLYHCIMATPFGSLTSFLQAGGRLLRRCDGMDKVILQDHGGSWHRHGSLNAGREWDLADDEFTITNKKRLKRQKEPITCPNCKFVRNSGAVCPKCGLEFGPRVRDVLQSDGELKRMEVDEYGNSRRRARISLAQNTWNRCFFRCLNSKCGARTLRGVATLYKRETGNWPNPDELIGVPKVGSVDWDMSVDEFKYRRGLCW